MFCHLVDTVMILGVVFYYAKIFDLFFCYLFSFYYYYFLFFYLRHNNGLYVYSECKDNMTCFTY